MKPTLKDTTLAMIVRDEENNPAGGIERNLKVTLLHVEKAVIVDTGSIDNTRDILENLRKEYSHLEVYDRQFDGFASSRNYSLAKVQTKRVLILDADELLTSKDFKTLIEFVEKVPCNQYGFYFDFLYPSGSVETNISSGVWTTRLFDIIGSEFKTRVKKDCFENIEYDDRTRIFAPVNIKHFLPSKRFNKIKRNNWYLNNKFMKEQPLENSKEYGWKKYNPQRDNYEG